MALDLQFAAAFHGFQHGDFVGVFDVAADGNAGRDARDFQSCAAELSGKVGRGGFAFDGWIGGDNNFVDLIVFHAAHEICDSQLLRADAVQRGNQIRAARDKRR